MFGMDASTAADAALWVILAAAFAFIVFGCYVTRSSPNSAGKTAIDDTFPIELDRAA
jgi:hypothetical protein